MTPEERDPKKTPMTPEEWRSFWWIIGIVAVGLTAIAWMVR